MLIHASSPGLAGEVEIDERNVFQFLPPFDEYLVSYKNRLDCIKEAHTKYAYNNFGIFQSVILHQGRITGNWRKTSKKGVFDTSFFPGCRPAAKKLIEKAIKECVSSSLITISLMAMSLSVMLREHSLLPNILQSVLRSVQHLS